MADYQGNISSSTASTEEATVKYGELIVLGYNGFQPSGDDSRRKRQFTLCQRPEANGVKSSTVHMGCNPQEAKEISIKDQYSVSYTYSQDSTDVVEYAPDRNTDMFQIGRCTDGSIDFEVVTDTGTHVSESVLSTVSRFACHIICQRSPPYAARIYAAGFNSSKNVFLGENAVKWKTCDGQMDGLTTNGVLVMHPPRVSTQDADSNLWREISVCGNVFAIRETSSPDKRGDKVVDSAHFHELVDGSLIDLCGITLLWRTAEGLARLPATEDVQRDLYAGRPWCQVVFDTLPYPSLRRTEMVNDKQPWAYLQCTHVHGYHGWKGRIEAQDAAGIVKDPQRDVCKLTLDPNTAHSKMSLFEINGKVTRVEKDQKYPDHQDRFKDYGQVMCSDMLTGRCYYWEVEWSGGVEIAVTYKSIDRQGDESQFGYNGKSWSLRCNADDGSYTVWHNKKKTDLPVSPSSDSGRVAVYVDWPAGTVSFYTVSSDTLTHLYTFQCKFTEALYAGFWVGWSDSSVRVCQREGVAGQLLEASEACVRLGRQVLRGGAGALQKIKEIMK